MRVIIFELDQSHYFNRTSGCSLILFVITSTLLCRGLDFGIHSYTIGIYLKTITEILFLLKIIWVHYPEEGKYIPKFTDCLNRIWFIAIKSIQSSLGVFGEIMSFELCTFFVAGFQNIIDTGSWVIF